MLVISSKLERHSSGDLNPSVAVAYFENKMLTIYSIVLLSVRWYKVSLGCASGEMETVFAENHCIKIRGFSGSCRNISKQDSLSVHMHSTSSHSTCRYKLRISMKNRLYEKMEKEIVVVLGLISNLLLCRAYSS